MRQYSALITLIILLVTGCSGQNNPTSPQTTPINPQNLDKLVNEQSIVGNDKHILGMWNIQIDESRQNITVNPLRNSGMHLNLLGFLEPPFCNNCLIPGNVQVFSETEFSIDVGLRHPTPDKIEYTVFDVRGILIMGCNYTFPDSDMSIAFGSDQPELVNADGYTILYNPVEFPSTLPESNTLELTPGSPAVPVNPTSTLNPFKAFKPNAPRRIFYITDEDTQTFHLKALPGPIEFGYAVDGRWSEDPNINNPLIDFPEDANCNEAYQIDIDLESWPAQGESSFIKIQVFDHQGEDTIAEVSLESPGLFDGVIVLQEDDSCGCGVPEFSGFLPNVLGGLDGVAPILVVVTDTSTDENSGDVSAYHVIRSYAYAKHEDITDAVSTILTTTSSSSSQGLKNYVPDPEKFQETRIGDLIVSWQQQTISNNEHTATVENAQIVYQFDAETGELVKEINSWRNDLPEILPEVIPQEEAELLVTGEIQSSKLYYMSGDSYVFPIEYTTNPFWVVNIIENDYPIVKIVDAITGNILGDAIPPPIAGYAFSGPWYDNPCSGTWTSWYLSAKNAFEALGYPTDTDQWPAKATFQGYVQDNDVELIYEYGHGGSYFFYSGCNGGSFEGTHANDIATWISSYNKKYFAFMGHCDGMCSTSNGTLSYAHRKGSVVDTATVGYCGMSTPACDTCWTYSIHWQNALFGYMEDTVTWNKYTIYNAFQQANADYPSCGTANCMRFAGDTNFTLYVNYSAGHICESCDDCISNYCEGSLNYPARCGINPPTEDGWFGGGDTLGCGADPDSEYRDYYFDASGQEQYEITDTFNCDINDDCEPIDITDYYVIENTNTCGFETWIELYGPGHLCESCDECASNYCEGSLNNPARCGINPPTEDGWIGGGDTPGCGADPDSEYRDYYYDSDGLEQFEVTDTFNCDIYDDCESLWVIDYYVIENTNNCDFKTWEEKYGPGHLCESCDECISNYCEGSLNNPARCGIDPPTGDGWIGGGNYPGCGPDPDSEYRDYYYDSDGLEQYEVTDTFNCDTYDDCEGPLITDYFVMENTNICDSKTWMEADPDGPILDSPNDGINFILGYDIHFKWHAAPGTNPLGYWFRVYHNGEVFNEYGADPLYGFYFGLATTYDLTSKITEIVAADGLWEWEVGAHFEVDKSQDIKWSEKRTIEKHTSGVLLIPNDGAVVTVNELFDWETVPGATNYVAKIKGLLPLGLPYYHPLNSHQSNFILTQPYYDSLKTGEITWAIAGTRYYTDNQNTLALLSYTEPSRSFSK